MKSLEFPDRPTPSATNKEAEAPGVSVITATYNAANSLPNLYRSLQEQDSPDFEWIVVDGGSSDGTVEILRSWAIDSPWLRYSSEPDFGIYHALNKGIMLSRSPYYVVAGADDTFYPTAIRSFIECATKSLADVILARVDKGRKQTGGFRPRMSWFSHARVFPGSHSVGMLFRKDLHDTFGMYSNRFPLLADGYFLKTLLLSERVQFADGKFTAGRFAAGGSSDVNKLQVLAETWQIQMLTERHPWFQSLLFLAKLVARYPLIAREIRRRSTQFNPKTK